MISGSGHLEGVPPISQPAPAPGEAAEASQRGLYLPVSAWAPRRPGGSSGGAEGGPLGGLPGEGVSRKTWFSFHPFPECLLISTSHTHSYSLSPISPVRPSRPLLQ